MPVSVREADRLTAVDCRLAAFGGQVREASQAGVGLVVGLLVHEEVFERQFAQPGVVVAADVILEPGALAVAALEHGDVSGSGWSSAETQASSAISMIAARTGLVGS